MNINTVTIWNDFNRELKAYIKRSVVNPSDVDDIMQDIFVKIIKNIEKVNQAKNLQQYIYGVARNAINDYFNNGIYRNSYAEIPEIPLDVETESLNSIIADSLKPFIDQLPEKYREAILMTEFQNVSQKELAERLNISYSGAKSRVQRGKEKLKEQLLDCCAFQNDVYGNIIDVKKKKCDCD